MTDSNQTGSFAWAMEQMKNEKFVYRKNWMGNISYLYLRKGTLMLHNKEKVLESIGASEEWFNMDYFTMYRSGMTTELPSIGSVDNYENVSRGWHPSVIDLVSTDWAVKRVTQPK